MPFHAQRHAVIKKITAHANKIKHVLLWKSKNPVPVTINAPITLNPVNSINTTNMMVRKPLCAL